MPYEKDPNEIGAIWTKTNDKGEYLSISLDLETLLALTGGAVGKVNLTAFPITFEKKANAPDYRLKYYVPGARAPRPATQASRPTPPAAAQPLFDDDIPF